MRRLPCFNAGSFLNGWLHRSASVCVFALFVAMGPDQAAAAPPQQSLSFNGVWSSTQCEPRPGSLGPYAQRQLTIAGNTFALEISSFSDFRCVVPTSKIRYEGAFVVRGPSAVLPGAWDVESAIRQARLTLYGTNRVEFFNSAAPNTCGDGIWSVGIERDLTLTRGCALISLDLRRPLVEYDIAKVEGNQLFLGQRPADGGYLNTPARRPTTFGFPLVKQAEVPMMPLLPDTGGDL